MIRHAIIATDMSPAADLLLDCTAEYKQMGIERVSLLHIPSISFNYMEYSGYSMRVHIEARMLNMQKKMNEAGLEADFHFREGLPSQVIVDFAAAYPDALLIIGSKGHGIQKRNLIGSTTQRVIQQSNNPVLMMRVICNKEAGMEVPGCHLESPQVSRHAILLTDFSPHAKAVFAYASRHLARGFRSMSLMHVQDSVVMSHRDQSEIDEFNRIDNQRLLRATAELRRGTDAPVSCILTMGMVVPEILREIKQSKASTIVLGTHGKGYYADVVCGSTASALAQLSSANCLFVPHDPDKEGAA